MAEKKNDCGCGCIPLKQNGEKPAKNIKKAKKSNQVEHCTTRPRGMGMQRKIPVPFVLMVIKSQTQTDGGEKYGGM